MEGIADGAIELLKFLLPGFVAAWVFYGLSAHAKPNQFERVIQALIFTVLLQVFVWLIRQVLFWIGDVGFELGYWSVFISRTSGACMGIQKRGPQNPNRVISS